MVVYLLQHVHDLPDGGEDVKVIGVYATEAAAREAIARLQRVAGFRQHPDGFHVCAYGLDQTHWVEGFAAAPDDGSALEDE